MSKIVIVCSILILFCSIKCLFAQSNGEPPPEAGITKALDDCIRQKRSVGIVVGLIDKHGSKVYARGRMNVNSSRAVDAETIFEIGSVTKVFTSLLLQDMVERGELGLDDPIDKFLPKSVKVPSKNGKKMTLKHLATHRSGLPRLPDNFNPKDEHNPYADYTVKKLYEFLSSHGLAREPGEKYEYSNLGGDLLGHVLSLNAGKDFETLIVKQICEPLKMESTRVVLSPQLKTHAAAGHNKFQMPAGNWDFPLGGAGGLRSSLDDLLKFLSANLSLTPSPLSNAMQKTHALQKDGGGFAPDMALGWHLEDKYGNESIWHNGGTGGFRSFIGFDKNNKRGAIVLSNSENDVDDIGWHLLDARNEIKVYEAPKQHKLAKIDTKIYDHYVGEYKLAPKVFFTITRDGDRLLAKLTGQSTYEVFPESEADFFYTVVDAQLTFAKDSSGKVSHLILHQNGIEQRADKIK